METLFDRLDSLNHLCNELVPEIPDSPTSFRRDWDVIECARKEVPFVFMLVKSYTAYFEPTD